MGAIIIMKAAATDTTAPTLSDPIDSETGDTTANVKVTTNEYSSGRVYWVITTSFTKPSAAQVKAGLDHAGAAAKDSNSWPAPPSPGTQNQAASGLTAGTFYVAHFMHEDAAGNQSAVVSGDGFTTTGGSDTTAPTLSNAVDSSTGSSTASLSVDTNEGNGTLYVVVTTSSTKPSASQIRNGLDHNGSAAAYDNSQSIDSTGTKSFSATGLSSSTTYYAHFHHRDQAGNDSSVVSGNGFTTDSGGGSQDYNLPGTYSFTVPDYSTSLTVTVAGPGGGGGGGGGGGSSGGSVTDAGDDGENGTAGNQSSFNGTVIGPGGGAGGLGGGGAAGSFGDGSNGVNGSNGTDGTGTGGDTNDSSGAAGGSGGGGGNGGTGSGAFGDGGDGGDAGQGGTGGRAIKTYGVGDLTPGASITVVVGSGGNGGDGGLGGDGSENDGSDGNSGFNGNGGAVNIVWT